MKIFEFLNQAKKYSIKNKWLLTASLFFILWKFFLITVLWHNRIIPPEPDDSYTYIGFIKSVKDCPQILCNYPYLSMTNYIGFTYLSYRIFFGVLAQIFGIDPQTIFQISFYLGTIAAIPVLTMFLKNFTQNQKLLAFSIFCLTLYNGSGSYHGFFWVVPSFFSLLLFFILFSIIFKNVKQWKLLIILILPIFIFLHPVSLYSLALFAIYYFIYFIFTKKLDLVSLKKITFTFFITLIIYLPFSYYLHYHSTYKTNPLGIETVVTKIASSQPQDITDNETEKFSIFLKLPFLTGNTFPLKSLHIMKQAYYDWLFPHWLGFIPFFLVLFVLFYYKKYKLLSFYFATIIFSLISSLHIHGYRSLIFTWPATFILYGFGFWYLFIFINDKIKQHSLSTIAKIALSFGFFVFISINLVYSLFWNQLTNQRYNHDLMKDELSAYLMENTTKKDSIAYKSKTLHSLSLNTDLLNRHTGHRKYSKYYLIIDDAYYNFKENNNSFFNIASKLLNIERKQKIRSKRQIDMSRYELEKEFGLIKIYRNLDYEKNTR
jgi:hypothetical protein